MINFENSESSDLVIIKFTADQTFDFEEELRIEFYKAVSSYIGSKIFDENSFNLRIRMIICRKTHVFDPRIEFIAG